MSSSSSSSSSSGIGVVGALGVAFVVLKLIGVIHWSWWWVTCPFWGGLALFLVGGGVIILGVYLTDKFQESKRKRQQKLSAAKLQKQLAAGIWDGDSKLANEIFGYRWAMVDGKTKSIKANGVIYNIGDKLPVAIAVSK